MRCVATIRFWAISVTWWKASARKSASTCWSPTASNCLPFSRAQRSLVYARAKNEGADKPFGTLIDVYQPGFEFISHSMRPAPLSDPAGFRVEIGGPQCTQPYSASLFNVSAMSFGALSANAIRALNQGGAAR
ncbi:hypothetical protein JOS77_15585 [Chromobacterium haemolyticum]|nr:hypothetical protein JOS77_15585 [Chromobacterium haemolyticum]